MPVSQARLTELARLFSPKAEVIAEYRRRGKPVTTDANQQAILELLRRRPCTEADVAGGLAMRPPEVAKHLADLEKRGKVLGERHGLEQFYRATTSTRGTPSSRGKPGRSPSCPSSP